jgi:phage terminase large subunit
MLSLARRLDAIEPMAKARSGNLQPSVYGIIDRVDKIDGVLVPNVIRRWKGDIGLMEPTEDEPTVMLVEKLEPFILKYKKYKCLFGGRGGMKTRFAQNVVVANVHSHGTKVYVLRERMTSLKESVFSGIESTIGKMGLGGFLSVPSKWEIRNGNGGKFVFGGMKNILDMKGTADFKHFLMEEAEDTKQKTIDTLGPTLRDMPGATLWYLWNTGSSQDAMSHEFISPYQADLDKYGVYEDKHHLIIKLTYEDNPWFEHDEALQGELDKDREKVKKKIMSESRFGGIWHGKFNDDISSSVVHEDWFKSCIDAHKKLGFESKGAVTVGGDPSDVGTDPFGYAARKGVVFYDIDEVEGEDGNRKMDEACRRAIHQGCDTFLYDADGLGATLRDNVNNSFKNKKVNIVAYKGSTEVHHPEAQFKSETANLSRQSDNLKNKDALKNKKAQNIIGLAERIYRTHEAVTDPSKRYQDPDTLISFDSESIKPEMMEKLKAEACKTPIKPGPTVQFYTKEELRKGVMMPDGNRVVIPSPNLWDAVVLSFDFAGIINNTMIDKSHRPRPRKVMRR